MSENPYAAISDPTRRAILDLLLAQGATTAGDLARGFPHISRPAVSKHLRVLREAGLVRERREGREWHYLLDPAPIRQMYEEWFCRYEQFWQDKLVALKKYVETKESQH